MPPMDKSGRDGGLFGISAALVTPFTETGATDLARAAEHARWVLSAGAGSVTLFGTTGEGASLGRRERMAVLRAMVEAGIAPDAMVVGLCATSIEEAVHQASQAFDHGVRWLLVPPPFYFKGVGDEALFAWYAELMDRLAPDAPRIIGYHIPQVTQVPLSAALLQRLRERFGNVMAGVKDSSGEWKSAEAFLAMRDLAVMVGDERLLARAAALGGAGTISGIANLFPARLADILRTGEDDAEIRGLVDAVTGLAVTPAIKALVAAHTGRPEWRHVRAPLEATPPDEAARLGDLAAGVHPRKAA